MLMLRDCLVLSLFFHCFQDEIPPPMPLPRNPSHSLDKDRSATPGSATSSEGKAANTPAKVKHNILCHTSNPLSVSLSHSHTFYVSQQTCHTGTHTGTLTLTLTLILIHTHSHSYTHTHTRSLTQSHTLDRFYKINQSTY